MQRAGLEEQILTSRQAVLEEAVLQGSPIVKNFFWGGVAFLPQTIFLPAVHSRDQEEPDLRPYHEKSTLPPAIQLHLLHEPCCKPHGQKNTLPLTLP